MENNPTFALYPTVSRAKAATLIESTTQWEFNRSLPHHFALENLMGRQIKWFTNKAKNLIGTITFVRVGRSWNYAVLRRNFLGKFQAREIGRNFLNLR